MKKFLALILALAMLFSMAACGTKSEEAEAKAAVDGFLGALTTLDIKTAGNYISDSDAIPEEYRNFDVDALMGTMPEEMSAYSDDFRELFELTIDKFSEFFAYEITDVVAEADNYIVTAKIKYPDFENADYTNPFENLLSQEEMQNLVLELLSSGELSLDSTEEEIFSVLLPRIIEIAKTALEGIELPTVESEGSFTVSNIDGKWLVDASLSEF